MRKAMTILCAIAFAISGIAMAITAHDPPSKTGYKTLAAATMQQPQVLVPVVAKDTGTIDLPEELVRDLAKQKGVLDTVYITKTDTIKEQVTMVKWRKVSVPEPVVVRDTIREAHYYLATQTGTKEGPAGECIPVYEIKKVDELCPEINSSVELSNELDSDVGE